MTLSLRCVGSLLRTSLDFGGRGGAALRHLGEIAKGRTTVRGLHHADAEVDMTRLLLAAALGATATHFVYPQVAHADDDELPHIDPDKEIRCLSLDVCGVERRYRDLGDGKRYQFVEVTSQPATPPAKTPE